MVPDKRQSIILDQTNSQPQWEPGEGRMISTGRGKKGMQSKKPTLSQDAIHLPE